MISFLLFSLFIGESFHFVHSAGTFTTNPPDLYGLASKSVFARRTKKVDGKLYIGGHSDGAVGTGAVGGFDFFIRKYPTGYSTTDTPLWTKMLGTSGTDYLGDFAVDAAGNVFAVGMCSGTVNSVATKGSGDACIFKLDSSGAVLCSRQVGGAGVDRFNGVALDEANGYFFAVGNTTSATFDGTSTVGKAAGIFYRFQMSDCTQVGTKYVQSMPLATQTMHFGGVVVLSTGQAVVGFAISTPTALPGSTGFNIAGYVPSAYANGGTFGFVKVNTTSGSAVPVQAISVAGTGGGLGAYANDIAIDAYETTYMSGHIMKSGSSGMIYIKASKDFSQTGAGSVWGTNDVFVRGLGAVVDPATGVVFFSGSACHTTPGTSYTFQSSSYTAPIAFVLAYTGAATSFAFQGKLIHTNGGATEDIAELDAGHCLAVGSSYGGFNGVAGTGIVDMFTYQFNFTLNPTSMPTTKPTRSPSLVPTTTITATPSSDGSASPTYILTQVPSPWPTVLPSMGPSHEPTMFPTEDPTTDPTLLPTDAPTDAPTEEPTDFPVLMPIFMPFPFPMPFPIPAPIPMPIAMPMDEPTAPPLMMPTEYPSAPPSVYPSVVLSAMPTGPSPAPTNTPSVLPSVMPTTAVPTTTPTNAPTAQPTVAPSAVPTVAPSVDPSTDPSAAPTLTPSVIPSAAPSVTPSAVPSVNPSVVPSVDPSVDPTVAPSVMPSVNPSVVPSAGPSADPSADPTMPPTVAPTAVPTATPTNVPTARPTDRTVRNLVLDVTQTVYNLDVAIYNVQKAAYNVTFQQTISTTLDGIAAQSVTDIQVEQISPAGRIRVNADGTVTRCALTYTLTVYDVQVAFSVYRTQLVAAVRAGTMDAHFRHYAGMHGIDNSSYFGDVKVFQQKDDSSASRGLTNAEIAAIVVGSALGVTLLIGACIAFCGRRRRDDRRVYHAPIKSRGVTPV